MLISRKVDKCFVLKMYFIAKHEYTCIIKFFLIKIISSNRLYLSLNLTSFWDLNTNQSFIFVIFCYHNIFLFFLFFLFLVPEPSGFFISVFIGVMFAYGWISIGWLLGWKTIGLYQLRWCIITYLKDRNRKFDYVFIVLPF